MSKDESMTLRDPSTLTNPELQQYREELHNKISGEHFGHYKWCLIGCAVAIPLTYILKWRGNRRWFPLLALASAGTIADYSEAYQATVQLRKALDGVEQEARGRLRVSDARALQQAVLHQTYDAPMPDPYDQSRS